MWCVDCPLAFTTERDQLAVAADPTEDLDRWQAGVVKFPAVELQTDDGKHEDGEEQQQADLEQGDHGFHDGLQHNLQALNYSQRKGRPFQVTTALN